MRKKNKNCVIAETETYKVQKPVPNISADLCSLSGCICFQFQFFLYFLVLVFKSRLQSNGIYSLFFLMQYK